MDPPCTSLPADIAGRQVLRPDAIYLLVYFFYSTGLLAVDGTMPSRPAISPSLPLMITFCVRPRPGQRRLQSNLYAVLSKPPPLAGRATCA